MIAFYLPGGIAIYTFSLILAFSSLIGLSWVAWQAPAQELSQRVDAGLWALLGGLISGRALYVALNWTYFQANPWESLQVYLGGVNLIGTIAGGIIFLAIYSWFHHLQFAKLVDSLIPLFASLSVCMWLGCWIEGCAYGPITSLWWGVPTTDEWGNITRRWPLQPVAALLTVFLFWALERQTKHRKLKHGVLASLGLLGLSMIIFGMSFLRVDPVPLWFGWRLDTWLSLLYIVFSLLTLVIFLRSEQDEQT